MTRTLKSIARLLSPFKGLLELILRVECFIARKWVSNAHWRLKLVQWGIPPEPENYDHHINVYYQWLATRNSLGFERGVFGSLALKGGNVLELACGDGFNARNFYSLRSKHITACDFEKKAIKTARRKNSADNIDFVIADIRTSMPIGKFENVVWDAAIEHFTPEEIEAIFVSIKERLAPQGIVSGYTIVERSDGQKSLSTHEYEFQSKDDLFRFIAPHFRNVTVFETVYPDRHNLYFWASDSTLPFSEEWPNAIRKKSDQ